MIFGAGRHTKTLLQLPELKEQSFEYIVDNDKAKYGVLFCDIPVHSPDTVDDTVDYIIISSKFFEEEIYNQLLNMGIKPNKIIKLYS